MDTSRSRPYREFDGERFRFELWRLQDNEYQTLRQRSFAIHVNGLLTLQLALEERDENARLTLPKALIVLEEVFGKSSDYFDTFKQTFAFPFLLRITKPAQPLYYLLKIADCRGGIEFKLYRIVDEEKYLRVKLDSCQKPIAEEFSETDIEYLISYLWGYLSGAASIICQMKTDLQPFFRHIDSSHVIYGFKEGDFFEIEIEDPDEYQDAVFELQQKYGEKPIPPVQKLEETHALIQAIID